jgi:hypothetical protein
MKMIKVHVSLWVVLLVGGFLLGFIPEYSKIRELQTQLESPQKTIDELKVQIQMGELRDAVGLMYLELSRQNFGLARDDASAYYNKLKDLISETNDPALKKSLTELAATQEALTGSLATASANSMTLAQSIVLRTFEITKNASGAK